MFPPLPTNKTEYLLAFKSKSCRLKESTTPTFKITGFFNLISIGFNNKEVTPELIEDGLDLDELMPKFTEISTWIGSIVNSKVKQLPNA